MHLCGLCNQPVKSPLCSISPVFIQHISQESRAEQTEMGEHVCQWNIKLSFWAMPCENSPWNTMMGVKWGDHREAERVDGLLCSLEVRGFRGGWDQVQVWCQLLVLFQHGTDWTASAVGSWDGWNRRQRHNGSKGDFELWGGLIEKHPTKTIMADTEAFYCSVTKGEATNATIDFWEHHTVVSMSNNSNHHHHQPKDM